jgi:hypothetical protein
MRLAWLLVLLSVCAVATAQDDGVLVTGYRNPVDKSYRKMIRGMDLFEKKRALAPNASLRFKLLPRKKNSRLDDIALEIAGDSVSIPVDLAPDKTFTLERHPVALREDASVRSDRKALSMTWRAEIRTPGLPPGTRRLGDLRLECAVGMEADLVSNLPSAFSRLAKYVFDTKDYCNNSGNRYLFFAERPLFGVTLTAGARREVLSVDRLYGGASVDPEWKAALQYCDCEVLLDRTYFMPLGDTSWPDDTLVQFEYMEDADARRAASR